MDRRWPPTYGSGPFAPATPCTHVPGRYSGPNKFNRHVAHPWSWDIGSSTSAAQTSLNMVLSRRKARPFGLVTIRKRGVTPGPPRHFFLSFLGFSIVTNYRTYTLYLLSTTKATTNLVKRCEYVPQRFSFPPNAELAIRPSPPMLIRWPWAEGYPQGGETPEVPGPAFDPVVTPVAEQEDPDRTHRADEYVSQWGVVVTAHIVLNLDAEHQPPHRAQHDRQQQTDSAYGASYAQVGNDQGVSALRQLLDRWLHWFGPTDWSPYHSL